MHGHVARSRLRVTGRIIDAMTAHPPDEAILLADVDRLIEEDRISALWFLRPDYHPSTREERVRALEQIERHGDLDAYRWAATLKRWPLQTSSDASAGS